MTKRVKLTKEAREQNLKIYSEYGSSGLKHWMGRVDEEWLRQLATPEKRIKVYQEMRDNDPTVGSVLYAMDMLVRQVEWTVEPAGKDAVYQEQAKFVEECMDDMSHTWQDMISEILSMWVHGWSYHEIIYKKRDGNYLQAKGEVADEDKDEGNADKRRVAKAKDEDESDTSRSKYNDGRIGWRKIPARAQETLDHWELDKSGGIKGLWQNPPTGELVFIPIEKALLFRTATTKGNPEGRSILRNSFRPWFFKKRIEEIEGIGIERDLAGLPVIYAPASIMATGATGAESSTYTELKKIVRNIRRDEQEGIVMPGDRDEKGNPMYELKLINSGGSRQFDTNSIIGRYDQRITMTMMADFILLGQQKVGSFALASSKTELFAVALGTYLDAVATVFNNYAIPRLFALNGMQTDKLPKIAHGDIESQDLVELGDFITKLTAAGAPLFPDKALEDRLRQMAKLPPKAEDADGSGAAGSIDWDAEAAAASQEDSPDEPPEGEGGGVEPGEERPVKKTKARKKTR